MNVSNIWYLWISQLRVVIFIIKIIWETDLFRIVLTRAKFYQIFIGICANDGHFPWKFELYKLLMKSYTIIMCLKEIMFSEEIVIKLYSE